MAKKQTEDSPAPEGDEYEILPHQEIAALKEELQKLKQFEITPTKKLHANLVELNSKLDRLLTIFEEASTALHVEEGGLSFKEQIRPLVERMNKILQQNAEIAQGIVAVADLIKEKEGGLPERAELSPPEPARFGPQVLPRLPGPAPGIPPPRTPPPAGPLPPPRRRRFGL